MKALCLLLSFLSWGVVAAFTSSLSPGLGFVLGLGVGAGAMLVNQTKL